MTPEERAEDVLKIWNRQTKPDTFDAVKRHVARAIRAAVAEEREACAKIAESWVDPDHKEYRPQAVGCSAAFNEGLSCSAVNGIADAIRNRSNGTAGESPMNAQPGQVAPPRPA